MSETQSVPTFSLRWRLVIPLAIIAVIVAVGVALSAAPLTTGQIAQSLLASYRREIESRLAFGTDAGDVGALRPGAVEIARVGVDGTIIAYAPPLDPTIPPPALYPNAFSADGTRVTLNGVAYWAARVAIADGTASDTTLIVLLPEANIPSADNQRLLTGAAAAGGAVMVIAALILVQTLIIGRTNRIRRIAEMLTAGNSTARTHMRPSDEIGALGAALDRYADSVQKRQDTLRVSLRRQRREIAHLTSVLEMLPDGVIVQDADGHVIFTNDRAKKLLGSQGLEGNTVEAITSVVTDTLGPALAQGLYALGNPQQVEVNGRVISAQVAAVTAFSNQRVGKVALLRDITDDVRRERAREALLKRLSDEIQQPLSEAAQRKAANEPAALATFAHEIARNAVALQKVIVEMRELSADIDTRALKRLTRPIALDNLIWALANEWRQVAGAANLKLQVEIERAGLYVLGDERRLRWAMGNLIDNAIKYTPPGGAVSLEIKSDDGGMARLRIRDNGAGIAPADLPHVFERFYRGTPITANGRAIRVAGTGQGLTVAKDIIEAHGGRITIKSDPTKGTAVYFTLPLTAPESLSMPSQPEPAFVDEDDEDDLGDGTVFLRPDGG
jgi:PAS domain S-box-containing protein